MIISKKISFRHLKGEDITSLSYEELIAYEDALENGLTNIREKKVIKLVWNLFL